MKVILHIGRHKTGSTAIQKFLFENRKTLLDRFGVLYPETGLLTVAHHFVAWSLQEPLKDPWALSIGFDKKAEDLFSGIFQEAKTAGASTVLISSEAFVPLSDSVRLDRLAKLLEGHEVHVMVYVRRQDKVVESYYGQQVRQFEHRYFKEFETYVADLGRWLAYTAVLDAWEQAIPGVVMKPRVYDRSKFPQGNVVADFLAALEIDMTIAEDEGDVNASLSPLSIRTLARINETHQLSKEMHERVVKLLGEMDANEDAIQTGFFASEARVAYLEQFKFSNQALFRRWRGSPNILTISPQELERYTAQDAAMNPKVIKKAVQVRLRKVTEYLENAPNIVKENQMADQNKTSVTSGKLADSDGAIELRDAAIAAIGRGEWQQALEGLQEAHKRRPTGPMIRLQLARVLLELGRAEEAKQHLEAISDFPAGEPLLSELRGRTKAALRETPAASKKGKGGLISSLKKRFAKRGDAHKKS